MNLRKIGQSILALGSLSLGVPVFGHAILVSATPGLRQVVHGPDVPIRLRFNSRIDQKRSSLVLVSPDGAQHLLRIGTPSAPDVIVSDVKGLGNGAYMLQWQVLANDGHITRGQIQFQVD